MSGENYINHIALVLDASGSMSGHRRSVITVADNLMAHLARRSQEMDQETRVTVYVFSDTVKCAIYDKDVLRLPSIATLYTGGGMTALIDATVQSILDLEQTAQLYGDHSFLTYVLTDGQENRSRKFNATLLRDRLDKAPENWTFGAFVPDAQGVFEAKRFGFPAGNIAVWDTTSQQGVEDVGKLITDTVNSYMTARASGIRGTRSLFSTGADAVNAKTVAKLAPMKAGSYFLVPVPKDAVIKEFVEATGNQYKIGQAYYQLMKVETIQGNKALAVVEKATAKVFTGTGVRGMIGLSDLTVRVKPNHNPEYDIFVQSTSVNRKLIAGTKVLILP